VTHALAEVSACGATVARAAKRHDDDAEAHDLAVPSATKQTCERSQRATRRRQQRDGGVWPAAQAST
jgi:hypothetical protein